MNVLDELLGLEERGWQALSTSAEAAREFYGKTLDDDVLMLFPGGLLISGQEAALRSMGGRPWAWYRIEAPQTRALGEAAGMVAYRAEAQREGADVYAALIASTYVRREDGWRLVVHQQTPV